MQGDATIVSAPLSYPFSPLPIVSLLIWFVGYCGKCAAAFVPCASRSTQTPFCPCVFPGPFPSTTSSLFLSLKDEENGTKGTPSPTNFFFLSLFLPLLLLQQLQNLVIKERVVCVLLLLLTYCLKEEEEERASTY